MTYMGLFGALGIAHFSGVSQPVQLQALRQRAADPASAPTRGGAPSRQLDASRGSTPALLYWVSVKELKLSYHTRESNGKENGK